MKIIIKKLEELKTSINELRNLMQSSNVAGKKFLNIKEASIYTRLSESKLYKMVSKREITFNKPEGKVFISKKTLDKYLMKNQVLSKEEVSNNISDLFKKKGADNE